MNKFYYIFKYNKKLLYLYYLYFIKYTYKLTGGVNPYKYSNIYMAISCISLCIPGVYGIYIGQYMAGLFGCIMSLFSLANDYFGTFLNKILQHTFLLFDKLGILLYIISLTTLGFVKQKYKLTLLYNIATIFIFNTVLYNYSSKSNNQKEWLYRHIIWHIVVLCYAFFVHYTVELNHIDEIFNFKYICNFIAILSIIIVISICLYILYSKTHLCKRNYTYQNIENIYINIISIITFISCYYIINQHLYNSENNHRKNKNCDLNL